MLLTTAITTIITTLATAAAQAWNRYQERKDAEHKTDMAIERGKQKIVLEQIRYSHRLQIAQLKSTPKWFKVFLFFMWAGPVWISFFAPEYAAKIFENMQHIPQWYSQGYVVLSFTAWGVAVSKEAIAGIFEGMMREWRESREVKYASKRHHRMADIPEPFNEEE